MFHPSRLRDLLRSLTQTARLDVVIVRDGPPPRFDVIALERARAEAMRCVETLPTGADEASESQGRLAHLVDQAEKVLGVNVPAWRSEESVEENVSLAEGLWEERLQGCRDLPPSDEVLGADVALEISRPLPRPEARAVATALAMVLTTVPRIAVYGTRISPEPAIVLAAGTVYLAAVLWRRRGPSGAPSRPGRGGTLRSRR